MMTSDEILTYLQNNFTQLYKVETRKADKFRVKYPAFDTAACYEEETFQFNGKSYTFRFLPNLVAERLYFSIFDAAGANIQSFEPLAAYPYNLAHAKDLLGLELYFYDNKVWYK